MNPLSLVSAVSAALNLPAVIGCRGAGRAFPGRVPAIALDIGQDSCISQDVGRAITPQLGGMTPHPYRGVGSLGLLGALSVARPVIKVRRMSAATAPAPPRSVRDRRVALGRVVHLADDVRGSVRPWKAEVVALDPATASVSRPLAGDRVVVLLLDPSPERARSVGRALVEEERARAARARPGRGEKFTAVRGTLRIALGRELGLEPREVPIVYGEHGKPALDPALGSDLHFNVSHTGGLAAIALARGREVGVDVELHRPRQRLDLIARATLTDEEHARFAALPEAERLAAFLDSWSAKEAYSKLLGRGLGLSFGDLELDAVRPRIVRLPAGPRHSGAVAA
jgi:4'-phosphopantetheinyl transferase